MNDQLQHTADALVAHCRNHTESEGLKTLYAPDARSIEAADMAGQSAEVQGIEAIQGKHDWWTASFDVHDLSVKGPMFHGEDRFSVIFGMDVTNKETNERSQMEEVAIYTINEDGKITKEEFFYELDG